MRQSLRCEDAMQSSLHSSRQPWLSVLGCSDVVLCKGWDLRCSVWNTEPNDYQHNEDCVNVVYGGRLNDYRCNSQIGFICEKVAGKLAFNQLFNQSVKSVSQSVNQSVKWVSQLVEGVTDECWKSLNQEGRPVGLHSTWHTNKQIHAHAHEHLENTGMHW